MRTALDIAAGRPWLITEEGLEQLLAIAAREHSDLEAVERAAERQAVEAVATRGGRMLEGAARAYLRDGVAVVPIVGPIFRYANLMTAISGATSTSLLARDFQVALDSPEVAAILLNADSPGGEAFGIAELAGTIRAARGRKPIIAYVGDMAASAAYWLISAADQIVLSQTGIVGSIGAVMVGSDTSMRDAQQGIRRQVVTSRLSPRKHVDPSTPAGVSEIQGLVDALAEEFVAGVAANRGVSVETVLAEFGQGGLVPRAAEAITRGMADRIGTFEGLLNDLAAAGAGSPRSFAAAAAAGGRTSTMDIRTAADLRTAFPELVGELLANAGTVALQGLTAETLTASHPALAAALRAEGRDGAIAVERDRISKIAAKTLPGNTELRDQAVATGMTYVDFLEAQTSAEQQKGARLLAGLRSEEAAQPAVEPLAAAGGARPAGEGAPAAAVDAAAPLEERAKAEWDKSAELRAEFAEVGGFDAYLAYRKAAEGGQVRRLVGRAAA